jgi:hypothetical protein
MNRRAGRRAGNLLQHEESEIEDQSQATSRPRSDRLIAELVAEDDELGLVDAGLRVSPFVPCLLPVFHGL